jgi:hypothetical protein
MESCRYIWYKSKAYGLTLEILEDEVLLTVLGLEKP